MRRSISIRGFVCTDVAAEPTLVEIERAQHGRTAVPRAVRVRLEHLELSLVQDDARFSAAVHARVLHDARDREHPADEALIDERARTEGCEDGERPKEPP